MAPPKRTIHTNSLHQVLVARLLNNEFALPGLLVKRGGLRQQPAWGGPIFEAAEPSM